MNIYILGICGTFMGGIAALARALGHQVSGADKNIYPPMSEQLDKLGIALSSGYENTQLPKDIDQVIVGNVMTRGMPVIESVLNSKASFVSGPQWLGEQILRDKEVYAVAGTHGKTTTSAMLAWILEDNNKQPGFLIGGVSPHFELSARLGQSAHFVIEADEYDSAFFDKRSKFVHYHANTLILNNLEFDHADIFADLEAIKFQFHQLIRTVPGNGRVIVNSDDEELMDVLTRGCWTPITRFGKGTDTDYQMLPIADPTGADTTGFVLKHQGEVVAEVNWHIPGSHNQYNATAALLAAQQAGVSMRNAAQSLQKFNNVKRRMEHLGHAKGIDVYDDFAHHPTAIRSTLQGVKLAYPNRRVIAILEPRSNSMRAGVHAAAIPDAMSCADVAYVLIDKELSWDETALQAITQSNLHSAHSIEQLLQQLLKDLTSDDLVVMMSNGSFANAPRRLLQLLNG